MNTKLTTSGYPHWFPCVCLDELSFPTMNNHTGIIVELKVIPAVDLGRGVVRGGGGGGGGY